MGTATINPSGSAEQTKYFTSTFDVKIGDNTTGTDGDGWSFNYGGTSFTGGNPEEGASAGLAITFDTFDNGSGDVFNQVQVLVDGAVRGTASAPGGTLLTETPRVLTLDGDNDYVDAGGGTGGEPRLTGTMTAEAWVQPDTFDEPTKVVSIGGKSGDGDGAENFLFQITLTTGGDVELFHEYGTGTNQQVTFDTNLTAGQWVHLAAVRDATAKTYTLYVNGQQSGSPQSYTTNAAGGANASLLIGGEIESNDAIGNTLNGQVDDVRIWNTARTASEVAENYQKTLTGDFSGNLVSHFTFDGGNANDSAGSNNGTLTNGAATTTSHTAPARFEPVSITVDANGLDMSYKGTTLFTNLDLGSAYNPQSGHQFVMSSRTGGADDVVAIDNLTITSTDAGSVNALVVDGGELAFKTTDSTGTSTVSSDVSVADGNWHHVAMSHDGNNTLKLYVDGVHVKTQTGVTKEMIGGDAAIGQASDSNADHFTGQIGEVRVWDAVMTDAQIDNNFGPNLSNPSSTSNLVGYWNMKDVSGQTVTDLSSNSNTATLGASGSGGGDDPTTQSTTYPQLNSSHWTIVEGAGSYNGDTILVQDGNVEISNRELLRSSTEYDPTSSNPLYVTGRFTFEKAADIFSVITRSSGVADSSFFGYPTTGVRFEARNETNNDLLAIYVNSAAGGGANDTALTLAGDSSINLKLGTEYEFEVFDDGTNLKFNMTEVGDPGNAASVTATSTFNPSTNYVVLTNREQLNTGNDFKVTVDDLRIDHSFVTGEGTAVSGTLNAPSVTGGTFSVVSGGGASNGTFTITDSSTGAFTYTPNAGFFGEETVRYQVTGSLDVQTVRINVNADLGVGIQSQALSFDGSNDYIDAGRGASDSLAIAGDLTVETWVKLDSLTGSTQGLIGFSGATNSETQANNILYLLAVGSDGTLSLSHEYDSGANVVMSSTETISVGEWVHVAGVRDTTANTWTLYLNGNAIANSNYGSGKEANGSSSGALKLGAIPITTGHDSFLDGQLDEMRIWNTTRSADDIRLSYDQQMTGSESGLVTYYRFDRVTDGTVDDLTSNNNTGTLGDTAEPTVIDGSGKVASFDGSGDYITVPNASALNFGASGSFTLEGWVNTTQSINYARVMIKPGGSSQQSYSLAIHNGKAHVRFDQSGGGAFFAESVDTVNDGQWHHVAGVFDNANDTLKVYIDGKLAGTTTGVTAQPLQDTDALQIGGLTGISQWFDGQMDDLRIWNTARTDAQIAENYQQTLTGNQSGALVAHYTFDSSNANDSAGSNNGTASGNTAFVNGVPDGKTVPVYGNAVSVNEGSTIAGHMTYDEVLSGSVSYHVMNGSTEQTSFTTTNGGTVTVDSTTGYWTYVPASAQSGTDTFTLRAKGATSGTDDEVVTVTVNKDVDKSVNVSDGIMQFDGSNDKVVSDGTITLTSHSMELWVNTTTTVADEGYLVTDQSGGAVAQILTNGNGTWRVEISNDLTNFKTYSSSVTVNDGQWHHLAYTFDATGNGTLKLYVDGVEDTSVTKTLDANLPSFSLTDELQMGVERGGNNFVDARIDEVRVWSDVRTSQEIQANYQNQITGTVPTQLKAYYRFDDEQTDGKVQNLGSDGNTLDATITEAQVINGFNKALNLDGSGDYVTVPAAPASSADMTLEAWFKWDGGNAWQRIFDFGEGRAVAPNDYMFLTPSDNNTNGKLTFGISTTAGSAQTMVGPALTAGQWYHAAVVIDSTADTGKLYLNGEAVATNTSLTLDPSQITTTVNYLGRSLHTADPDFDGQIGEFRIWNTARTDAQIADNYNNPLTGSESGLVTYYTFDELVSGAVVDEAGANNATVTGATIVNIAPTVYGTEVTIQENEAVTGTMATNDVAGTPTYSVQTAATKGTVIVDSTSGEWTYVPDVNYRGTDTFTLRATGATRGTDDETITVTVNAVNNDSINVHDGMVQFDGSNDLMRATVGTNTFSNQITGEYTYTPASNFYGIDTFTLTAAGDGDTSITDSETVSVTVNRVDHKSVNVHANVLKLDGSNDYVHASSVPTTKTDNITIETWFNWDGVTPTKNNVLVSLGTSTGNGVYVGGITSSGSLKLGANLPGAGTLLTDYTFTAGEWTHVALVRESGTWKFYVNGENQGISGGTASATSSITAPDANTWIGHTGFSSSEHFGGRIDEVRIWDDARTADEIRANYDQQMTGTEQNLQAYYRFEDNPGRTTVTDLTYNNHDGTLTNGAELSSTAGKSMTFDSSDDFIDLGTPGNLYTGTGAFTYEAWIKTTQSSNGYIVAVGDSSNNGASSLFFVTGGKVALHNPASQGPSSSTSVNDGQWHHVAATYSGGSVRLFVDGKLDATGTMATTLNLTSGAATIGKSVFGQFFNGEIADVRIWNDLRSDTEIREHYQKLLTGGEENLIAYYSFDDATASAVNDLAGSHNGTVTGAAVTESTAPIEGPTVRGTAIDTLDGDAVSGVMTADDLAGNPTYSVPSGPANGTVTIRANGEWTYTPTAGFVGTNTFTLRATDGTRTDDEVITVSVRSDDLGNVHDGVLQLDGSNDYVEMGRGASNELAITGNVTVEAWVNLADFQSQQNIIAQFAGPSENVADNILYGLRIDGSGDLVYFHEYAGAANEVLTFDANLTTATWAHVAVVRDVSGNTVTAYVNGNAVGNAQSYTNDPTIGGSSTLTIGEDNSSSTGIYTKGAIDDLRIWNTARTAEQIKHNYDQQQLGSESGLVAYYKFDDDHTGTTAADSAGTASNGTLSADSKVLSLDGTGDYLEVGNPSSIDFAAAITVEAWIKTSNTSGSQTIVGKSANGSWASGGKQLSLLANGKLVFNEFGGSLITGTTAINDGQWHHVAMTISEGGSSDVLKLYVDGVLETISAGTGAGTQSATIDRVADNGAHLVKVGSADGAGQFFNGQINDVRFWSDVRTQSEIYDSKNTVLVGNESGLARYFDFDRDTTAADDKASTNTANNGTLNGNASIISVNDSPTASEGPRILNTLGKAGDFDGSGDTITTSGIDLNNKSFSWEFWVNRDASDGTDLVLGARGSSDTSNSFFHAGWTTETNFRYSFEGSGSSNEINYTDTGGSIGQWAHWAGSFDATSKLMKLYKNGQLIATKTISQNLSTDNPLIIGGSQTSGHEINAKIDEVRIWYDVRTDQEILDNYNQTIAGDADNLAANYHFDAASGALVDSATGVGGTNSGTLNNDAARIETGPNVFGKAVTIEENETASGRFEADSTSYSVTGSPSNGAVVIDSATGAWIYTPTANFHGTDSFTVNASGVGTETVTVTVNSETTNSVNVADGALQFTGGTFDRMTADIGTGTLTNTLTLEMKVRFNDVSGQQNLAALFGESTDHGLIPYMSSGTFKTLVSDMADSSPTLTLDSGVTVAADTWYHLAVTYDGTTANYYVDGDLKATGSISGLTLASQAQKLVLGGNPLADPRYNQGVEVKGLIDEVRVWSDVRTAAEIRANKDQQLAGSEGNLEAYYRFDDDATGTTIEDITSNNRHGTTANGRYC